MRFTLSLKQRCTMDAFQHWLTHDRESPEVLAAAKLAFQSWIDATNPSDKNRVVDVQIGRGWEVVVTLEGANGA